MRLPDLLERRRAVSKHDTPRIDPVPETSGLPERGMPSPEETEDGLLPNEGERTALPDAATIAADLGIELPEDPGAAADVLAAALLEVRLDAGDYLESMQRIAAEFDNFRKRVDRDQGETVMRASQRIVERLLPALDSFDAALAYEAQTPTEDKILDGMRGTHTQLMDILESEGLSRIPGAGQPFDPAVHEAAAGPSSEGDGPLVVAQELRSGYVLKGRVVRPSLVTVEHA